MEFFYNNRQLFYLIIGIFAVCMLIKWLCLRGGDRLPSLHSFVFTGGKGAGKTYLSAYTAVTIIKKRRIPFVLCSIFPFIAFFWPESRIEPKIYSTFPIVRSWRRSTKSEREKMKEARRASKLEVRGLKFKEYYELRCGGFKHPKVRKWIPEFYPPLQVGHLTGDIKVEEGSIFVLDEAGRYLAQWDYNNPLVQEQIAQTSAMGRHFFNEVEILADQCSDNIVKAIRCRTGMIYHLHNFRRAWGVMPWFKVNYIPLLTVEDGSTTLESDGESFFVGPLPYRWQRRKKMYESRYLRLLYYKKAVSTLDSFDGFETNYIMDISVSEAMIKLYKNDKKEYKKRFLYDANWRYDVLSGEFVFEDPADVSSGASSEAAPDSSASSPSEASFDVSASELSHAVSPMGDVEAVENV